MNAPGDRRRSVFSKAVLQLSGQVTFGAILLVNSVVVSKFLGPEERGKLALLVFIPYFSVFLINLGFASGMAYFASRGETAFGVAAGSTIVFGLGLGSIFAAAGGCVFLLRSGAVPGLTAMQLALSASALPALLAVFCFEPLWVAADRVVAGIAVRLVQGVVYLAGSMIVVGAMRLGTTGAIASYSAAIWISLICVVFVARRADPLRVSLSLVRRVLVFGWRSHPGSMAEYILYRGDTYLVGRLAGFTALGFYSFAQPFAEIVWMLSVSLRPVLFTETARAGLEGGWGLTARGVRLTLLAGGALSATILTVAMLAIPLWLPAFTPSVPVLGILLAATTSATVFQLLVADMVSRGEARVASRVSLLALAPALLVYATLIPRMGAIGAALASLFAYSFQSCLALWFYRRMTGAPLLSLLVPTREDLRMLAERVLPRKRV